MCICIVDLLAYLRENGKQWNGHPKTFTQTQQFPNSAIKSLQQTLTQIRLGCKVERLASATMSYSGFVLQGEVPPDYNLYSTGLHFMLKRGRCTKTAASDLETTAYFLGQLRDYVHLKSSEEGSGGEVELQSSLFFVPIGPS